MKRELLLRDLRDTERLAKALSRLVEPGMAFFLKGDLGAGKTQLTKFLAKYLGEDPNNVSSPTFSIIHEYDTRPPMAHIDLYRVGKGADLWELGIGDYLERGFFFMIEWADYLDDNDIFENPLTVTIKILGDKKRLVILDFPGDLAEKFSFTDTED